MQQKKIQKPIKVVAISLSNKVLIKASESFNLNASHYLEVLKSRGLENRDIQVINKFN